MRGIVKIMERWTLDLPMMSLVRVGDFCDLLPLSPRLEVGTSKMHKGTLTKLSVALDLLAPRGISDKEYMRSHLLLPPKNPIPPG